MSSSVFVIDKANALIELNRTDYDSEDLFQTLLADHPALLGQASGASGKLLLVERETAVPEIEDGSGRWSLDHLFLDREGVPVLVEVKRSSDTRLRREVVAQMLDYAANGVAYWPIEQISSVFAEQSGNEVRVKSFMEFLGGEDPDPFWRQVESNLKAGRVRMVFVADRIPKELRRIVEFLNEQMRPAEVLAIEVEQFTGADGLRLLTPRVVGATERAASAKAVQASKPPLSEEQWLNDLMVSKGEAVATNARRLLDWFRAEGFLVGMTDSQDAMYARLLRPDGKPAWPFFVRRSSGKVETSLQYLKDSPAFESEDSRLDLLNRIKALPGQVITTVKTTGWPAVLLQALSEDSVWQEFTKIAQYVKDRIATTQADTPRVNP
jgi:hypothetical protein